MKTGAGHPVVNSPEKLKAIWDRIGVYWGDFMLQNDGAKLKELMAKSDLKALGVFGGIMTEKVLLLSGQPTQIFGYAEHQKMDELEQALMKEIERRKRLKLGVVDATVVQP